MRIRSLAVSSLLACALLGAAGSAYATLISSESFTGSAGPLAGRTSGVGWTGAWVTGQSTVFSVSATGLSGASGPNGATGGSVFYDGTKAVLNTGARAFRQLDLSPASAAAAAGLVDSIVTRYNGGQYVLGKVGTTVWLGAVYNGGTAGNGQGGVQYLDQIHLYDGATTTATALGQADNNKDGEAIAIGRGNTNVTWNYERTCAHDNCPGGSTSSTGYLSTRAFDNASHWLVMRFTFTSAATTNITTWLDPAPGAVDPLNTSALLMGGQPVVGVPGLHFNWIEIGGETAQFSFDELRFASTFAELSAGAVLSVPPSAEGGVALRAGPSPGAGATQIAFDMPRAQVAEVRVIDVAGRTVRMLAAGVLAAGTHTLVWDGRDAAGASAPAGLYLVRLRGADGERVVRIARVP